MLEAQDSFANFNSNKRPEQLIHQQKIHSTKLHIDLAHRPKKHFTLSIFIFASLLLCGTLLSFILLQQNQDIRQQASEPYLQIETSPSECVGEGDTVASGTGSCCAGLVITNCSSQGSFSYCYCRKPQASPTIDTTSTQTCTIRTCSGTQCVANTKKISANDSCASSNCITDSDCFGGKSCDDKPAGTQECNSSGGYNYCNNGQWNSISCPTGTQCSNGQCINKVLTSQSCDGKPNGTKECNSGDGYNYCSNGSWHAASCPSGTVCSNGTCIVASSCDGKPSGSKKCNSSGNYNYCKDGQWFSASCPSNTICTNGECVAASVAETLTCDGKPTGTQECNSSGGYNYCNNGSWHAASCPSGTVCSNGSCNTIHQNTEADNSLLAIYNILNTVTLGTFGNYVQTYNNINNQNSDANYLERAFDPSGVAASAQLGTVVTAEGAVVVGAGSVLAPVAGGAATAAYSYGTATLATLPAGIQTGLAIGGTVAGVGGVIGGTSACVVDPYSDVCMGYVAGLQGDPLAMAQLDQGISNTGNLISKAGNNFLKQQVENSLPNDIFFAPDTNSLSAGMDKYYDTDPIELLTYANNNLIKSLTGYDIDSSLATETVLQDAQIIRAKYQLPPISLNSIDPYEYRNQLTDFAKQKNISLLTQNQTTFFESHPQAGGVNFSNLSSSTIAYKDTATLEQQNTVLTHELVHALQEQIYPDMPIEIMEYEAYLSQLNTANTLTPSYLNNISAKMVGSINTFYIDQGLIPPTTFEYLK